MAYLILVRHGQSDWNAKGLWTGLRDIPLTDQGRTEARKASEAIADIPIDYCYTSPLSRSKETLEIIKAAKGNSLIPTTVTSALNERDYGEFTGKNKWKIKDDVGDEVFLKIRRSWDYPIPKGESLKDVYNRVTPFYKETILPLIKNGKNIIIVSSGNTLRALIKYLENISDNSISNLELATGEVDVYQINNHGEIIKKSTMETRPNIA